MENAEGEKLLEKVVSYVINPALAYFHLWQPDNMVLWDNWRLMYCACGAPEGERRFMQRTTIAAGDYGLGRTEGGGAITDEMRRVSV